MAEASSVFRRSTAYLRRLLLLALLLCLLFSMGLVLLLRWVDPPTSAVILQRSSVEGKAQVQRWVPYAEIDPQLALAVIAAEDQRFPRHWGFDTREILSAVERRLEGGPLRGASTISQQVARNLFLWQGRSFLRKGLEAWFTVLIEALWSKQRILEMYLNFAEMGPRRFGVGAVSQEYFGRPPEKLGARRAALLAAVLPNPRVYRADRPGKHERRRQDWILGQMRNLGGLAYLARLKDKP